MIRAKSVDRRHERLRRSNRHQQAVLPIDDDIFHSARRGGDDGKTAHHRLNQRERRAFEEARQQEQIGRGKRGSHAELVLRRVAMDAAANRLRKLRAHDIRRHARTNHVQRDVAVTLGQRDKGRDEILDALVLAPGAGKHHVRRTRIVARLGCERVNLVGARIDACHAGRGAMHIVDENLPILVVQAEDVIGAPEREVGWPERTRRIRESGAPAWRLTAEATFFLGQLPRAPLETMTGHDDRRPRAPGAR